VASDDAAIALCGPCRHFEQALSGRHTCTLGLALLDGAVRRECASFHPFARGEGSLFEQSDCCAHGATEGHAH
jgi:hypothetical protein